MARTVRDANLESRAARGRLKVGAKPYFRAIDEGLHLGYRKGKAAGKWVMRWYVGDQTYRLETIGTADDNIDADGEMVLTFSHAQAIARRRFVEQRRVAAGLPPQTGPYTVAACLSDYLTWLEQNRKTAKDARWRSDALIIPALGASMCMKLTTKVLRDWLEGVANAPVRVRTKKGKAQQFRANDDGDDLDEAQRRRRSSANRVLTILKAALNHAWREKKVPSDDAWRALKPFKQADAARVRYLTIEEAKRLLNACETDFRNLVHAALLTGARFSELAALVAGDFNQDSGTIHIRTSKSGKGRHVVLTEEGTALFTAVSAGRASRGRMLPKVDGGRWAKSHQSRPMHDACKNGKIDPPIGFHGLRHTYASLTIMAGAPLNVVAHNLGHADTRMVEKHYGHMAPSYIATAIRTAAPRFGVTADRSSLAISDVR